MHYKDVHEELRYHTVRVRHCARCAIPLYWEKQHEKVRHSRYSKEPIISYDYRPWKFIETMEWEEECPDCHEETSLAQHDPMEFDEDAWHEYHAYGDWDACEEAQKNNLD